MQARFVVLITIIALSALPFDADAKEKKDRQAKKAAEAGEVAKETKETAETTAVAPKQEVVRDWKSISGQTLVRGKFWHVGGGILQVREEGAPEAKSVNLADISPEDIQYILNDHGRVIGPTCKLLRSGYAVSADGQLIPVPASEKMVIGTVGDIVDGTMAIIKIGTKSYMVMCNTSKLRKGKTFEGYLKRQSESMIDLPNGQQGYLYRAYLAVQSEKHLVTELRNNPRPYLNQITGSSAEYVVWLETQRQLGKIKAIEKKKEEIAAERTKAKLTKEQENADRAKDANREKLAIKYQKEIDHHKTRLKETEADIKRLEARKRSYNAYSNNWNNVRNRIRQLETEVLRIKKTIRELNEELRKVD